MGGALVVEPAELLALEDVDDVGGGDVPPSLHPVTSAPPSTITATYPLHRERTSLPLAVPGTAAAEATDRLDSTDISHFGHPTIHRPGSTRTKRARGTYHRCVINY